MSYRITTLMANRSRRLRKAMTEPEVMLWSRLKGRGKDRPVFRRRYVHRAMIFDFYCPAARLALKIDGSTHWDDDHRAKDEARDAWLAGQGIAVMRIGAGEVYRDLGGVADAVILRAEERLRLGGDKPSMWLSLSTTRSAAGGPPLPLRGKGRLG